MRKLISFPLFSPLRIPQHPLFTVVLNLFHLWPDNFPNLVLFLFLLPRRTSFPSLPGGLRGYALEPLFVLLFGRTATADRFSPPSYQLSAFSRKIGWSYLPAFRPLFFHGGEEEVLIRDGTSLLLRAEIGQPALPHPAIGPPSISFSLSSEGGVRYSPLADSSNCRLLPLLLFFFRINCPRLQLPPIRPPLYNSFLRRSLFVGQKVFLARRAEIPLSSSSVARLCPNVPGRLPATFSSVGAEQGKLIFREAFFFFPLCADVPLLRYRFPSLRPPSPFR